MGTRSGPAPAGVLPYVNHLGFYEFRFESIGGLGAHLAGQTLAEACVLGMGLNGAHFSSYGSEKKGTPVRSYVRVCALDRVVRTSAPVLKPHLLAIFHEALGTRPGVLEGLYPYSVVVVNTHRDPHAEAQRLQLSGGTIAAVDALRIALEEGTRVNTAMLGAIARAADWLDRGAVREAVARTFQRKRYAPLLEANLRTFDRGYREVRMAAVGEAPGRPPRPQAQELGYLNQPLGGTIIAAGSSALQSLVTSRTGKLPEFLPEHCTHCGLCDMVCPDFCFVWEDRVDAKGRPAPVLLGIDYQYCKGCMKCVEACPQSPSALVEREETEGYWQRHRVAKFPALCRRSDGAGAGSEGTEPAPTVRGRR